MTLCLADVVLADVVLGVCATPQQQPHRGCRPGDQRGPAVRRHRSTGAAQPVVMMTARVPSAASAVQAAGAVVMGRGGHQGDCLWCTRHGRHGVALAVQQRVRADLHRRKQTRTLRNQRLTVSCGGGGGVLCCWCCAAGCGDVLVLCFTAVNGVRSVNKALLF